MSFYHPEPKPSKNRFIRLLEGIEKRLPVRFGQTTYIRFPRVRPRSERRAEYFLDRPYVPPDVQAAAVEKMRRERQERERGA